VAGVGHEVPADFLDPPALRLVLGQQQHQAAIADSGAQRRHPDREARGPAVEAAGRYLDLALADLTVPADLANQREQFTHDQVIALDQPERTGR
jgi:hypothetical protein